MKLSNFKTKSTGFSLLELVVVLIIIAIVLAIGIPGINQARTNAELETMRARAVSIQNAKLSYISAVGTQSASGAWQSAGSDQNRFANLLIPYLPNTTPTVLAAASGSCEFMNPPYSVNLNTLGHSVTLYSNGTVVPLQKY